MKYNIKCSNCGYFIYGNISSLNKEDKVYLYLDNDNKDIFLGSSQIINNRFKVKLKNKLINSEKINYHFLINNEFKIKGSIFAINKLIDYVEKPYNIKIVNNNLTGNFSYDYGILYLIIDGVLSDCLEIYDGDIKYKIKQEFSEIELYIEVLFEKSEKIKLRKRA